MIFELYPAFVDPSSYQMRKTVEENMGDIERQIREKPVQATIIAAGIGFLIGALITR